MTRKLRLAALMAGTAAVLAGCQGSAITAARLSADVGATFRNMYVLQQHWLGNDDPGVTTDTAAAVCMKGIPAGSASPAAPSGTGPGDNWVCVVHWPAPSGITESLSYDVRVQPGGCYTADGPAPTIGQQTMQTADGDTVPNPLYEFDGCLS